MSAKWLLTISPQKDREGISKATPTLPWQEQALSRQDKGKGAPLLQEHRFGLQDSS